MKYEMSWFCWQELQQYSLRGIGNLAMGIILECKINMNIIRNFNFTSSVTKKILPIVTAKKVEFLRTKYKYS
jgi:hypothetical protein